MWPLGPIAHPTISLLFSFCLFTVMILISQRWIIVFSMHWWRIEDGMTRPPNDNTKKAFDKKSNSILLREFRISGTKRHQALLLDFVLCLMFWFSGFLCFKCICDLYKKGSRLNLRVAPQYTSYDLYCRLGPVDHPRRSLQAHVECLRWHPGSCGV